MLRKRENLSGLRRKVATGAVLAIACAALLGLGTIAYLPPQQASTSTITMSTSSQSTTGATTITSASTTITVTTSSSGPTTSTSTTSSTTTVTTSSSTTTTTGPIIYSGKIVAIDPALQVSLFQSILLTNNVTLIANGVASALNELPIILTGVNSQCVGCGDGTAAYSETYYYRTATGSSISVTLVQGTFYELGYAGNATTTSSFGYRFSVVNASKTAANVMTSLGIPASNASLAVQHFSLTPGAFEFEWSQSIEGVPLTGALIANSNGNYVQSISASFQFNPQSSQLTGLTIVSPNWYQIPLNFSLWIGSSEALNLAADYAASSLGMTTITSEQVGFMAVQNHIYYAVTLGADNISYVLFVNPRTGEVGLPAG